MTITRAFELERLAAEASACALCAAHLPLGPRPVFRVSATARLLIIGQAPGTKVHETGIPLERRFRRTSAPLDGHRPRGFLRYRPHRHPADGLLLSRPPAQWWG